MNAITLVEAVQHAWWFPLVYIGGMFAVILLLAYWNDKGAKNAKLRRETIFERPEVSEQDGQGIQGKRARPESDGRDVPESGRD